MTKQKQMTDKELDQVSGGSAFVKLDGVSGGLINDEFDDFRGLINDEFDDFKGSKYRIGRGPAKYTEVEWT